MCLNGLTYKTEGNNPDDEIISTYGLDGSPMWSYGKTSQ